MNLKVSINLKRSGKLPEGIDPRQLKYAGKTINVRAVPIIVGWIYEQAVSKKENKYGKWAWPENLVKPINQRKKK